MRARYARGNGLQGANFTAGGCEVAVATESV